MGIYVRRIRFENKGQGYKMRCQYCHRPKKELYQARFSEGGPSYLLCPGLCIERAGKNYKENLEKGLTPYFVKEQEYQESEIETTSNEDNIVRD